MSDIYVKICADTGMTADGLVEKLKVFENLHTSKKEMDIILNSLDLELQNNKVAVLKENKKVVGLDFSEHDKVFEDKIAKLEKEVVNYKQAFEDKCKDYDSTSELLNKFGVDNESLKQRIAELESKETEKPTKINLNDRIKVKLTPLGAEIYYHQYDEVNKKIKENYGTELEPMMPRIDKDGYTEFQLHHFISLYGEHIGICKPNVINPLDIVLVDSHQTHPQAEIGT